MQHATANAPARHSSMKSEGELAGRHASVLLAKTNQELTAAYDKWGIDYDQDLHKLGGGENTVGLCCLGPLKKYANANTHSRLIDIGCGTGYAAPHIHAMGWREFTALVLSQGMLDIAEKRGVYDRCIRAVLPDTGLPAESYDVVHSAGMFAPAQAPSSSFGEFIRLLKPKGLAVFSIRQHYYDSDEGAEHKDCLLDLVAKGKWEIVEKTLEPYLPADDVEAYVFVMQKL
ncbi:unnamed protein product [Polarella glacialis]|uniref:Methyltransferase type 11 domain-containing protein n=1 Tax=Polarella glacialis TaxID=89957 RepID=A0A813IS69_POLGL|nr:unnamed protein product [Polarella glacialis]CAE8655500.1 unnamed protein product [Polarella glacialis]